MPFRSDADARRARAEALAHEREELGRRHRDLDERRRWALDDARHVQAALAGFPAVPRWKAWTLGALVSTAAYGIGAALAGNHYLGPGLLMLLLSVSSLESRWKKRRTAHLKKVEEDLNQAIRATAASVEASPEDDAALDHEPSAVFADGEAAFEHEPSVVFADDADVSKRASSERS